MSRTYHKLPADRSADQASIREQAGGSGRAEVRPPDVRLTLKELVRATEVSERTIRYYIQKGVLPPPQGAGPASRYGLEHLTRLSLVRRFKAALLPLAQIKSLLAEISVDELEKVAEQLHHDLARTHPVLDERARPGLRRSNGSSTSEQPATELKLAPVEELEVFRPPADNDLNPPPENSPAEFSFAGRWNRIALAPGLELHYQESGPQDNAPGRERLAQLIELAMRLYQ